MFLRFGYEEYPLVSDSLRTMQNLLIDKLSDVEGKLFEHPDSDFYHHMSMTLENDILVLDRLLSALSIQRLYSR